MAESFLEFNNPLETTGGGATTNPLAEFIEPAQALEPVPPTEEPVTTEATPEPVVTPTDPQNPVEPPVNTETSYVGFEESLPQLADNLVKLGIINYVPEGVDAEALDSKGFEETIKANVNAISQQKFDEGAEYERGRIVGKLGGLTKDLVGYNLDNPNADEGDLRGYLESMLYVQDITSLDPEVNSEKIVREYYKSTGWTPEEVSEKVIELTEGDKLKVEAKRVKPKLDRQAQEIATQKSNHAQEIKAFEDGLQDNLHQRTVGALNKGKINNIPLSKDEADFLYSAIMNNEVAVNLKGKKVEMGFAEALVRQAKYDPNKNIEHLMLGLLVIDQGPAAIEKYISKQARTKETEKFIKEIKFSNTKKSSSRAPTKETGDYSTGIRFNM